MAKKARNKIGMYGETPRLIIGGLSLCRQNPDGDDKSIWIEDISTGEGAEFDEEKLSGALLQFYKEHF